MLGVSLSGDDGVTYSPTIQNEFEDDVLLHIPDDGIRYEWVHGRIMQVSEPDPLHGCVGIRLGALLFNYVDATDLGVVFGLDTLFLLKREPRTVRGPDVAFVAKDRMTNPLAHGVWAIAPDLVAEVRSPSQSRPMMRDKVKDYLEAGVRLVWVVDPDGRSVTIYRSGQPPRTLGAADELEGEDALPGFRCVVASLFP
jgi:Uma2 family endonuclease